MRTRVHTRGGKTTMATILKKKTPVKLPTKSTNTTNAPAKTKLPLKKSTTQTAAKGTTEKAIVERNEWGIAKDSDQARVLEQMIQGGIDKHSVIVRCDEMFDGELTSGGKPKPSSTIMNQLIRNLTERGFKVEASWKFVPPENGLTPAVRKVRASKAKATTETKPAVANAKKALSKLPTKATSDEKKATSVKAPGKLPTKRIKASS